MYLKNGLFLHFLAMNICFTKRTRKLEVQNMVRQLLWYFWAIPTKISDLALTSMYPNFPSLFDWTNTILWIFITMSVLVTLFGRPLRCSSWQLVRPRLNSATQYFIVVNEGADSPWVESSSASIFNIDSCQRNTELRSVFKLLTWAL